MSNDIQPEAGHADDAEESDVDFLRGYECPNGCDVVDVLTEDDAMALVVSDPMLCPICDEELERSEESARDLIEFVDECTRRLDADTETNNGSG